MKKYFRFVAGIFLAAFLFLCFYAWNGGSNSERVAENISGESSHDQEYGGYLASG